MSAVQKFSKTPIRYLSPLWKVYSSFLTLGSQHGLLAMKTTKVIPTTAGTCYVMSVECKAFRIVAGCFRASNSEDRCWHSYWTGANARQELTARIGTLVKRKRSLTGTDVIGDPCILPSSRTILQAFLEEKEGLVQMERT